MRARLLIPTLVALLVAQAAHAEPIDDGDLELSAEELAAIEAALAADAGAATTSAAPAPARRGGGGLQSLNPDISFIADVALAAFTSDEPLQTGGHDPTARGFNLQQLELAVGKAVDPYFRFDANIVFSQYGVEIEEVYATTLAMPARTQLRIGQFLTRIGRTNPTHPHTWAFVDQAMPIGRVFGGEGNRGLGIEGSVLLPLPWYVEVLVSETMLGGESTGRSWSDATALGVRGPLDLQTTVRLEQFFPLHHDLSLAWGMSWASGPNGTGRGNRSEVYATDLYLKYRPITSASHTVVSLTSEWFYRRQQVPEDVLADVSGFTQVSWKFSKRWGLAARHEVGTPSRDLDGEITPDARDPLWTDDRHRVAANVTYWPTEFSRVRLQGSTDFVGWREQPDLAAFLAFEFNVGAHGAHKF